jgi:hypothetical protein
VNPGKDVKNLRKDCDTAGLDWIRVKWIGLDCEGIVCACVKSGCILCGLGHISDYNEPSL